MSFRDTDAKSHTERVDEAHSPNKVENVQPFTGWGQILHFCRASHGSGANIMLLSGVSRGGVKYYAFVGRPRVGDGDWGAESRITQALKAARSAAWA